MRGRRLIRLGLWLLVVVAVLVTAVGLALDPLITWRTRVALSGLDGMRGTFRDVDIRVRGLAYVIHDLRIEKVTAGGARLPYFQVDRAEFGVYGKELLHGNVVADITLDGPRLNLLEAPTKRERQDVKEAPKLGQRLEELAPFRIDRAQVRDGEIVWIDAREKERPILRLHGIEATIENFATRAALAKHEPTVLAARGTLQKSGKVSVFATADPLAKALTFAGQAKLDGLRLTEIARLLDAKADVVAEEGVLDLAVRFRAVDGKLDGGVRPVLTGAEVKSGKASLGAKVKAFLVDAALDIFDDDARDAVATTIPIVGTVRGAQVQAVPTIVGILRNAFVRGLEGSLAGLPPPKAKERHGALEQARRGLSPSRGQPEAQPTGGEGK
jgi:hypothetical protein